MKNFTLTLSVAAAALLTIPSLTLAEDKPAGERPKRPEGARRPDGPGGHFGPEERLKHMTETLGLSKEQQEKIKAILEKDAPKFKEIFAKGRDKVTDEDRAKMRELMKAQTEEISAVLTPEQKEKWKAEMEKRRAGGPGGPRGERKRGEAAPGAPKPDAAK